MTETAERNRSQSLGIFAIVGGLLVAVGAAVALAASVLLIWLFVQWSSGTGPVAVGPDDGNIHVEDPNRGAPELPDPVIRPRPGQVDDPTFGDPTRGGAGSGPPPGPASVLIPKEAMFLSIEVNCPEGFRARGDFAKVDKKVKKATVQNVPGGQRCTVTFQGSAPVKAWVNANQTLSCTFDPITCYPVH